MSANPAAPDLVATRPATTRPARRPSRSIAELIEPSVLADPYPLYRALREQDPVMWDPVMHAWIVTSYSEVVSVLLKLRAARSPSPAQLAAMGVGKLEPIAELLVRQMLFMDPPGHTHLRALCSVGFTPRRVERLIARIEAIADELVDRVLPTGRMDVLADFAAPLPAIVTAQLLGLPEADHRQLKAWSADFAEMLGNFQHNADRADLVLRATRDMVAYFEEQVREQRRRPRDGLLSALLEAEVDGERLSQEEVVANAIVTMVGGQETTTNLIGCGLLSLLQRPADLARLRDDPSITESAVEELLRFESPSQHTGRLATADFTLGGKRLREGDAVLAVMAAGNRDPARFPDPDTLDLTRSDNRHLAFGWGPHFCFGAPLARIEGRIAFSVLLRRLRDLRLEPGPLAWRENLGLRGLKALPVAFTPAEAVQ